LPIVLKILVTPLAVKDNILYGYRYIPWEKDIQLENAVKDNILYGYHYIPWGKEI
jgi:hypothetical protein